MDFWAPALLLVHSDNDRAVGAGGAMEPQDFSKSDNPIPSREVVMGGGIMPITLLLAFHIFGPSYGPEWYVVWKTGESIHILLRVVLGVEFQALSERFFAWSDISLEVFDDFF